MTSLPLYSSDCGGDLPGSFGSSDYELCRRCSLVTAETVEGPNRAMRIAQLQRGLGQPP